MGLGRFRPGPPRILETLDVAHRISNVSRGLAPFPKVFQLSLRLEVSFKRTLYLLGICHPCCGRCRFKRQINSFYNASPVSANGQKETAPLG